MYPKIAHPLPCSKQFWIHELNKNLTKLKHTYRKVIWRRCYIKGRKNYTAHNQCSHEAALK